MRRGGEVVQIALQGDFAHAIANGDRRVENIQGDIAPVGGIERDHAAEKCGREHVRPASAQGAIAPAVAEGESIGAAGGAGIFLDIPGAAGIAQGDVEMVIAPIGADHQVVVGSELDVHPGVEIVEKVAQTIQTVLGPPHRFEGGVDIGAAAGHHP